MSRHHCPDPGASVAEADEIVVADGGSSDGTQTLAARPGRVCWGAAGRGPQLAAGVAAAHMANGFCCCTPTPGCRRDGGACRWTATRAALFPFALDSDDPRARADWKRLVTLALPRAGTPLWRSGPADPSRSADAGGRHPAAAADGRCRPRPPPRPPAAGGADATAVTSAAKWQRMAGIAVPAQSACLSLCFAGCRLAASRGSTDEGHGGGIRPRPTPRRSQAAAGQGHRRPGRLAVPRRDNDSGCCEICAASGTSAPCWR